MVIVLAILPVLQRILLAGLVLGKRISKPSYFKTFNLLMAALLVYVSLTIGYEHVITPLVINARAIQITQALQTVTGVRLENGGPLLV